MLAVPGERGPINLYTLLAGRLVLARLHLRRPPRADAPDDDEDAGGQPHEVSEWGPLDVVFETAGEDAALETAIRSVRIGGRVVIVGIPGSGSHTLAAGLVRRKGLSVILSRRMKAHHLVRAIGLVRDGHIGLSGLISGRYSLADGPAALSALAARDGLKVIVAPNG